MYRVSDKFRTKVYSGEALYDAKLSINGQTIPDEQIASIIISDPIIDTSTETFYLGSFISKQITIKFKNLDGLTIESGLNVYLEIGQEIDGEYEYVPIGNFLIDELDENYFTTCEITCLDYAVLFKPAVDYSPAFTDGKATIDEILIWLCSHFGVTLGNYPSTNGNVEIGVYDGSISGKQWISYIAEIKGCNAKIDRTGVLQLIPFNNVSSVTINALESEEWELGEPYKISKIVYFDALRNFTYGDDKGNTLFIRQDNPFITDTTVVENIYENILATTKETRGESIAITDASSDIRGKLTIYGNTYQEKINGDSGLEAEGTNLDIENVNTNKISYITLKGNTYQEDDATPQNPKSIETVTGSYQINIHHGLLADNYSVDLGNIELCQIEDYQDYIYKENNKWYYTNYFNKIDSYNGEIIETSYISTTGGLDTGATIYYYNPNAVAVEITNNTLKSQLNALYNAQLYETFTIDSTTNNLEPNINVKYNIVIAKPSVTNPSNIVNVTGLITITNKNMEDEEDENYQEREYEINLGNIELLKIENIQDTIYYENKKWYYTNYFTKINSYNNEQIETIYISTTGGLDIGATVYYFDNNNTPIEITNQELISSLNDINNILLFENNNFISSSTTNQKPIMNLVYFLPIDFTLYSLKTKNYGDISLDAYDVIDYVIKEEGEEAKHYLTYNNNICTYEMNISSTVDTQISNKQKEVTTNHIGGDIPTKVKMLKTNLDHVNNEIELLVEEQEEQDRRINQTIIDVNSTRNIFQITGGSNLIKNSQFLYDDPEIEEDNVRHRTYWDLTNNGTSPYNNLGDGYDSSLIGQTVSLAKIQLRNTILQSRDLNITDLQIGQIYTLNYYYRQDNLTTTRFELLNANNNHVTYNEINQQTGITETKDIDITYNTEQTRITNQTFQFVAPTSTLKLKITTAITSGVTSNGNFYIYDLMLNSGDKKSWELASSEIYSTTIQMSNLGLQVITADEDIATLLTAQGFQVVKYDNGKFGAIVTSFNKKGIKTNEIESNLVSTGKFIMTEATINNKEHHIEYFVD